MLQATFDKPTDFPQALRDALTLSLRKATPEEVVKARELAEWMRKRGAVVTEHKDALTDDVISLEIDFETTRSELKRTRAAGRRPSVVGESSPLYGLTYREVFAWAESHTAEEGARALGVSRASWYRRLKAARERVAADSVLEDKPARI